MKSYNKNELLILCTGCQGEPNAAARKIATHNHPTIRFTKGDLMIFSSKIIPGNEKKIFELFDELAKKQIDVMTEKDHFVHVSGHPSQDELREMYYLARPKIAIPVHGEFIHTKTHGELAQECNVPRVIHIQNGAVAKLSHENFMSSQIIGYVKSGYFGVDGKQLLDLNSEVIRERRKLSLGGIVTISLAVDKSLKLLTDPQIICVGSYDLKNDEDAHDYLINELEIILKQKAKELGLSEGFAAKFLKKNKKQKKRFAPGKLHDELEKIIRGKMLKIFENIMGKRPALEVILHIID
jgi:ribonuclease J